MRIPVIFTSLLCIFMLAGCQHERGQVSCVHETAQASSSLVMARDFAEHFEEYGEALEAERVNRDRPQDAVHGEKKKDAIDEAIAPLFPEFRHPELIDSLYWDSETVRPHVFLRDGALTPAGHVLMDVLGEVDVHALDYEGLAQLERALELVRTIRDQTVESFEFNDYEIQAIADFIEREALKDEAAIKSALKDVICDFEKSPVPRAAAWCEMQDETRNLRQNLEMAAEYALADAWLWWAESIKFGSLEKFSAQELERYATSENPNDIHPKYFDDIVENRLKTAFEAFAQAEQAEAARSLMDSYIPSHEQYVKLQRVRERYRRIVDEGGWDTVPAERMMFGGSAPIVRVLKKRLQIEGYYEGEIDEKFDASLAQAIQKYQKYHQLEETGEVNDVFWRSLNVPAEQRLSEIEVNLRRWHKTVFEPRETYIYVNIPSFTIELWQRGTRISVHRAVVGSSTRICNTRTREWELMNSTRLMHARMTYLVFNPYWNVPPRIEVDEFLPKMAADSKWLENSDFEYYTPKGGGRVLRQKPGAQNALGRVKLIFPNRYNIYIHDTPSQNMFNYPIRAFSHGCMRVEGAMQFAREVLEIDGQWDSKRIDRFFVEKGEHPVDLKTAIDVFIDYHTVTVDAEGNAYFLADIYKKIRDEMTPPTEAQRRCDPAVDMTSPFRSGGDAGP